MRQMYGRSAHLMLKEWRHEHSFEKLLALTDIKIAHVLLTRCKSVSRIDLNLSKLVNHYIEDVLHICQTRIHHDAAKG